MHSGEDGFFESGKTRGDGFGYPNYLSLTTAEHIHRQYGGITKHGTQTHLFVLSRSIILAEYFRFT